MKYSILLYNTKEDRRNNTPNRETWIEAFNEDIVRNVAKTYLTDNYFAVDVTKRDVVILRLSR